MFKKLKKVVIEAQVVRQATVTSTLYKTSLTEMLIVNNTFILFHIDSFRLVIVGSCTCVYNASNKCKHIAALIYYINTVTSPSKTSIEQLWRRPSARKMVKDKYSKEKNFFEMILPPKTASFMEPCEIPTSQLKSPSALKFILHHESKNKNDLQNEILMKSKLEQVQLKIKKQDCEECIKSILLFCDTYEVYKAKIILLKELCDIYEKHVTLSEEKTANNPFCSLLCFVF
ncbi:hypothetical protein PV327_011105 [Microctonus hyperodae]|uniref:SWIM-type domain-containing protein n=1 Tax=Microctonus hyperodae TaxID=165561 RepID=A0AA39EXR5_MICHY|nr:hypothetical protein PV327_011105 [Microctonus hyperodae]